MNVIVLSDDRGDRSRIEDEMTIRSCSELPYQSFANYNCNNNSRVNLSRFFNTYDQTMMPNISNFFTVDIRSTFKFCQSHLKDAVNVNLADNILRKRMKAKLLCPMKLLGIENYERAMKSPGIVICDDCCPQIIEVKEDEAFCVNMKLAVAFFGEKFKKPIHTLNVSLGRFLALSNVDLKKQQIPAVHANASDNAVGEKMESLRKIDTSLDERMSKILPRVYLGDLKDAYNIEQLRKHKIKYILNVTKTDNNLSNGEFIYKRIPVDDSGNENLSQYFEEAISFISDSLRLDDSHGVLIHCHAGISRSASILLAYLIGKVGMPLQEAYKFVKEKRTIISPNIGFLGQLVAFEKQTQSTLEAAVSSSGYIE